MSFIKVLEELFHKHDGDSAKAIKEFGELHETVYQVRQHVLSNEWRDVDRETYDRVLYDSGHNHARKLYRHKPRARTTVPKSISVELR